MKKLIVCLVMLCTTMAYAVNDDVVNSQMYVDNAVGNLQTNLPAKTSDKVVTYTTTAGTTGERDIKTTLGNETTNQADTGISTIGTVNTALDDKQNKVTALPATNVVTYSNTAGTPTVTPIYDSTVNTFDNGLVNAKTLNDAVIAGVNAEATKIQTSKGALWSFNRTAPKVLPTTANLPANIQGYGWCYKNLNGTGEKFSCSAALYDNKMVDGDFGIIFPYNTGITYPNAITCSGVTCGKEVRGISACSNQAGGAGMGTTDPENIWATLDAAYNSGTATGKYCHCKIVDPFVSGLHWGYGGAMSDATSCAASCAGHCAWRIQSTPIVRAAVFSASPVPAQ